MYNKAEQINVKRWDDPHFARVTYQEVMKRCGKESCKCRAGAKHGPYWYKITWDARGQKTHTEYLGTVMPAAARLAIQMKRFAEGETARTLSKKAYDLQEQLSSYQKENDRLQKHLDIVWVDFQRAKREIAQKTQQLVDMGKEVVRLQAELYIARIEGSAGISTENLQGAQKVYKRLVHKYHPDQDPATAEFMKDLNQLWQEIKRKR